MSRWNGLLVRGCKRKRLKYVGANSAQVAPEMGKLLVFESTYIDVVFSHRLLELCTFVHVQANARAVKIFFLF